MTLLLALLPLASAGDFVMFNAGYGFSPGAVNTGDLNEIFTDFNEARPFLDEEMSSIDAVGGIHVQFTRGFDQLGLVVAITTRSALVGGEVEETEGTTAQRWETRLRMNSWSIGAQYAPIFDDFQTLAIGATLDHNPVRAFVRTGVPADIKDVEWEDPVMKDKHLGATIFLQYNGLGQSDYGDVAGGLSLRPYYQFRFKDLGFNDLDAALNGAQNSRRATLSHFGIQATLAFGFDAS